MDSCKHLDERRLTGTVLTDNRMDFARLEFKINGLQGVGGTETLVELFEHEKRRAGRASSITVTALLSLVHRRLLVIRCSGGVARRTSFYLTLGVRSSFERSEFIFSLVMRFTPVSTSFGTFSPFDAASAVLMPSYPIRNVSCTTSAWTLPSARSLTVLSSESKPMSMILSATLFSAIACPPPCVMIRFEVKTPRK